MTIGIGMICKESIVLASDSQASYGGPSTHKRTDTQKIVEANFSGTKACISMAGGIQFFNALAEKIELLAPTTEINSRRSVADVVQGAVRALKSELMGQAVGPQQSGERWDAIFRDSGCELMIAYYFEERMPCLYEVDFSLGLVVPVKTQFHVVGCAFELADFILADAPIGQMSTVQAMAVAAYVVEMAKNHDQKCGGRTQMALVYPKNASVLDGGEAGKFEEVARQFEAKTFVFNKVERTDPPRA